MLRIKSESPPFFKKLRMLATYWAGGFGAAYASMKLDAIELNKRFDQPVEDGLAGFTLFFVAVLGGTFLPTMNKTLIKEQMKEDVMEKTKEAVVEKVGEITKETLEKK